MDFLTEIFSTVSYSYEIKYQFCSKSAIFPRLQQVQLVTHIKALKVSFASNILVHYFKQMKKHY